MKPVATNRRAKFDYEITETVEAGIILSGQEVKSCRKGHIDLSAAYVTFPSGKAILKGAKIRAYDFASNIGDYSPGKDRQLLLKKREIEKLKAVSEQSGMSVIPLEVRAGKFIKIVIGIGRGRKTIDKRARIKERDINRRMKRGEEV